MTTYHTSPDLHHPRLREFIAEHVLGTAHADMFLLAVNRQHCELHRFAELAGTMDDPHPELTSLNATFDRPDALPRAIERALAGFEAHEIPHPKRPLARDEDDLRDYLARLVAARERHYLWRSRRRILRDLLREECDGQGVHESQLRLIK